MKKIIIILTLSFCITGITFAQVPNSFRYQAVVRDASGNLIANRITDLRISILGGSSNGQAIYVETFNQYVTNDFGIVALDIGSSSSDLGDFLQIDWGANTYYLQVEIDINGGGNYLFMGTSKILSVPYAIHALNVTNKDDADADPNNEIQTISKNGNLITLSDGGLSVTTDDADADITNEIQDLFLDVNTNILRITNNPDATPISLSAYQGANTDQQILSYTTNVNDELELTIGGGTGGNTISIPFDFISAQGGGTFLGNIYAPNLTTANMDNNDIVDAYQAGWAYYMTQDDKTELGFLSLTNNFSVSGGAVSLNAAEGSSILNLPASGYLATRTWVNNNTLINSLLYGHILVGNSSGSAIPVDASGNAEILIGNGNTIRSRGIFGDISLLNTGAVTVNSIGGQNISLGSSFTTTTDDIILNANVAGSNVTLPISGILANQDYVDDEIATNNNLTTGNILVGNGGVATALPVFTNGRILIGDGTTINSRPIGGDATLASNGILTLENTTVTAGTYAGIAVNSKGLITSGTTLTTLGGYGITDAMSTSHDASVITTTNIANWNNAFGWGDHASEGYITDGNTNWDNSYGFITGSSTETLTNKSGSNSMWTNNEGYISSFTEADPIFTAHVANTITNAGSGLVVTGTERTNWNNAFGWGNHVSEGYITDGNTNWDNSYGFITASSTETLTNKSGSNSMWTNDEGYISAFTEADPIFTTHVANTITNAGSGLVVTGLERTNWNNAFGWGNHASEGYITDGNTNWDNSYGFITGSSTETLTNKSGSNSMWTNDEGYISAFTEADPIFTSHVANTITNAGSGLVVTGTERTSWNNAFGWGNHASQGYITDGNTNWNNSYGFITGSSTETLTNKSGSNSMWANDEGYLTAVMEEADESTAGVGQTSFTLSSAPSANSIVKMYIDGLRVSNSDYNISGTTLNYTGTALLGAERIQFDYYH